LFSQRQWLRTDNGVTGLAAGENDSHLADATSVALGYGDE